MSPSPETRRQFPVLDTVRLLGALAVLTTHAAFQTGHYDTTVTGTLLARLDVGVAVFFVLSGFLLARPVVEALHAGRPLPRVRRYALHRLVRVYPPYLATVVAVLLLVPEARGGFVDTWLPALTLTTIYVDGTLPHGLTQMWSLETEVAFYLLLPLLGIALAALARGRAISGRALQIGCLATVVVSVAWISAVEPGHRAMLWLPSYLSWFGAGIFLAVSTLPSSRPSLATQAFRSLGAAPWATLALAGGLLLVASTPIAGPIAGVAPTPTESVVKHLLYCAVGLLVVVPGVYGRPGTAFRSILELPALRYLGRISYGIFCVHVAVLYAYFSVTGSPYFSGDLLQVWVVTVVVSVALAAVMHRLVERPAVRWGRRGQDEPRPAGIVN